MESEQAREEAEKARKDAALWWLRELNYNEEPTVVDAVVEIMAQCLDAETEGMRRENKTMQEIVSFVYEQKQRQVGLLNKAIVRLQERRAELIDDVAQLAKQLQDLPLSRGG